MSTEKKDFIVNNLFGAINKLTNSLEGLDEYPEMKIYKNELLKIYSKLDDLASDIVNELAYYK